MVTLLTFVFGLVAGFIASKVVTQKSKVSEDDIKNFADDIDEIEDVCKGSGVGFGYSVDMEDGTAVLTIRVNNVGTDFEFDIIPKKIKRQKRDITTTLGLEEELPPSLRGQYDEKQN